MATIEKTISRTGLGVSRQRQVQLYLLTVFLNDVVMLSLAFFLAYVIRFEAFLPFFDETAVSEQAHLYIAAVLLPVWLGLFALFHLYDIHYLLGSMQEYMRVFNASTAALTLIVFATFLIPVVRVSRGWIVIAWTLAFLLVSLGRFFLRRVGYRLRARGLLSRRTLIVGADEEARAIARQLVYRSTAGAEVLGFVDNYAPIGSKVEGSLSVLGSVETLPALAKSLEIDEMIISTSALPRQDLLSIFQTFGESDQVELRFSSGLFEIFTTGVQVKEIAYVPLVSMRKLRIDGIERFIKSVADYTVAILSLVVLAPILAALVLLIKLDSPGPAIHRRRVLGQRGRAFDAYKFRTMYVNGDEIIAQHPELQAELKANHKLKVDPRVTRVGRWLRRYSLDELPQLLNVLLGQMSMVGPRMISPAEAEKYSKWRMNLLTVKPGITGLWQIGGRSDLSYEERVRLDMYYIRNYSIWLDLYVLWQTIPVVLQGKGAY